MFDLFQKRKKEEGSRHICDMFGFALSDLLTMVKLLNSRVLIGFTDFFVSVQL